MSRWSRWPIRRPIPSPWSWAPDWRPRSAGQVDVEATALSQGRTQQLWRVDFTDESGRLIAHGELRLQNVDGKS